MKRINKEKLEEKILIEITKATTFFVIGMFVQKIATEGIYWISTIGYLG